MGVLEWSLPVLCWAISCKIEESFSWQLYRGAKGGNHSRIAQPDTCQHTKVKALADFGAAGAYMCAYRESITMETLPSSSTWQSTTLLSTIQPLHHHCQLSRQQWPLNPLHIRKQETVHCLSPAPSIPSIPHKHEPVYIPA
jgi:hypothetical protein